MDLEGCKRPPPSPKPIGKVGCFAPNLFQGALGREGAVYISKIEDFRPGPARILKGDPEDLWDTGGRVTEFLWVFSVFASFPWAPGGLCDPPGATLGSLFLLAVFMSKKTSL